MTENKKILVVDGISGVPLAREIQQAFLENGIDAVYLDGSKLHKRTGYGLRSAYAKFHNKRLNSDGFYHFPRSNPKVFEQTLERERPDAVLVVGFIYKFLEPAAFSNTCRKHGAPLYLYDTDSCNFYSKRREFIFFLDHELPVYDEIFSFSQVTTKFFTETKRLNASYFPFGANVILQPSQPQPSNDVLFVGSADLRRIFLLENIRDEVTIYGNRWQRNFALISSELRQRINDKPVWGSDLHRLLADSKIVLNITRADFYGAETGINLRIFEALAAGCFLLTDHTEEIAQLFDIGREIETFRSAGELSSKVRYYLEHPEERLAIARRGHQKFLQHYTWQARTLELGKRMGLLNIR